MLPGTPGSAASTASACAVMSSSDVIGCELAQLSGVWGRRARVAVRGLSAARAGRGGGRFPYIAFPFDQSYTTTP